MSPILRSVAAWKRVQEQLTEPGDPDGGLASVPANEQAGEYAEDDEYQ